MAEEKVMVCGGFIADDEKDCVAGGGRWMDENDILLRGVGASKGEIIATVRIVDGDKTKMAKIASGDVMVGDRTVPDDMPFMKNAGAFIMNKGGKTSHTGIAATELGKPAVTGTLDATKVLKDGQKVLIDGNRGLVLRFLPGMEVGVKPKPKPAAVSSLAERMAAVAAKKGIDLPPGFTEKQKQKE